MKTIRSLDIMPPRGELFGFPKTFTPAIQGNFYQWLIENGYPVNLIARDTQLKLTNIKYYEDGPYELNGEPVV